MLLFNPNASIEFIIGILIAALVGMTVHEFAHNYVGYLMGDPVPAREGRLTLNPGVHIYWPGFIMFVLIGFGILGTAPISANRMRNPRWGYLLAVAAGPFSNLLLAVIFGIVFRILGVQFVIENPAVWDLIQTMVLFNILLFIFNLLPLFPIDGWHIVLTLLPPEPAYWWQRNAQLTQYVFIALLLFSFLPLGPINPLNILIREPLAFLFNLILGL